MVNEPPLEGPNVSTPASPGFVEFSIAKRVMKTYVLHQNELTQVSTLNGLALIFASIGSALLSFAGTIWLDAQFDGLGSPVTIILYHYVAPVSAVLSAGFFLLASYALYKRYSVIDVIKKESEKADG